MKIAIFQFSPEQGNVECNRDKVLTAMEEAFKRGADILLLPELWTTGVLRERSKALFNSTDQILKELVEISHKNSIVIIGGMPELVEKNQSSSYFNTCFVTDSEGALTSYRKINLFKPMGEDKIFDKGKEPSLFNMTVKGKEITAGIITCFDIRFPALSRHLATMGAEIIFMPSLWPMARKKHLELLARARAVENQCFTAVSNACGLSGDTEFAGSSGIYAPDGHEIVMAGEEEGIIFAEINLDEVKEARQNFITAKPENVWQITSSGKLQPLDSLKKITKKRQASGQKMVFTNGCFDILHPGHTAYLETAREQGDFLVIGINSDSSIRNIKGESRPVNNEHSRASVLSALASVDYVVLFSEETPYNLIDALSPDVLVKGADWEENQIVGADIVKKRGGRVVRVPFIHQISTSLIIEKINKKDC